MACDFCDRKMIIDGEYDSFSLGITRLYPLSAINLTTGEKEIVAEKPYYSLFLYEEYAHGEIDSFRINYCPLCGERLGGND